MKKSPLYPPWYLHIQTNLSQASNFTSLTTYKHLRPGHIAYLGHVRCGVWSTIGSLGDFPERRAGPYHWRTRCIQYHGKVVAKWHFLTFADMFKHHLETASIRRQPFGAFFFLDGKSLFTFFFCPFLRWWFQIKGTPFFSTWSRFVPGSSIFFLKLFRVSGLRSYQGLHQVPNGEAKKHLMNRGWGHPKWWWL